MKTNMKKGKTVTRKIITNQIEFDAAVADPQGVAVVQFVGDSVDLVVEKNFPFVLDYIGKSKLVIKPEAGPIAVQVEDATGVVCDNPEAFLRVYDVAFVNIESAKSVSFLGTYTEAYVAKAESVSVFGMSTVSVTKADMVSACDRSEVYINGPAGRTLVQDKAVVKATAAATGVIQARGTAHVALSEGCDITLYAYDGSTVNARGGRVLATDGSVVAAVGDVRIQASGCATVVLDDGEANVVTTGRAVVVPRLWDESDLEEWIKFTGARVDGDDLVLYTWIDDKFRLEENPVCPFYKWHKASIADAATFLSKSDRLFEVRVDKSDVKELLYDRLYASKFTPVREVNLANPFEENN
jgi:hypothetical protein